MIKHLVKNVIWTQQIVKFALMDTILMDKGVKNAHSIVKNVLVNLIVKNVKMGIFYKGNLVKNVTQIV